MEPAIREAELLEWAVERCRDGATIELEEGWDKLYQNGVCVLQRILEDEKWQSGKPFGTKGFSALYTISYKMSSHAGQKDFSRILYDRFKTTIERYLADVVAPKVLSRHDLFMLKEFCDVWENHKIMTKWMWRLFMHLDRGIVVNNNLPTLTSCSLNAFYTQVFRRISLRIRTCMLNFIERERNGEFAEGEHLRNCVQMLEVMGMASTVTNTENLNKALAQPTNLQVYVNDFETPFLHATRVYLRRESAQWISNNDIPSYISKAEAVLESEESRCRSLLNHSETSRKLSKVCAEELVVSHKSTLAQAAKDVLKLVHSSMETSMNLQEPHIVTLTQMYNLFHRTQQEDPSNPQFDLIKAMAEAYGDFVREMGDHLISARKSKVEEQAGAGDKKKDSATDTQTDTELIEGMLELLKRTNIMTTMLFQDHKLFAKAAKDAFASFVNRNASQKSNVEVLACYCDKLLKKGGVKMSEPEIEDMLKICMELFWFFSDKDMFAEIYRDYLAKRLLNNRHASNDLERFLIGRMKHLCGAPFTSKLEGMLTDFALGDDMHRQFCEHLRQRREAGIGVPQIEFQTQVLTTGFWPSQRLRELNLPTEMAICISTFTDWYNQKHNHRLLKWVYSLGEVTIAGLYPPSRKYSMLVTTIQSVALMCFNDSSSRWLSFVEVKERTGVSQDDVLKRVLHSLACGKMKLLNKNPMSKSIAVTDTFSVNTKFTSALRTFRVPMASLDDVNVAVPIAESRGFAVDASIVRIMKARKRLVHSELQGEVINQLRYFTPQPKLIKQRIEMLIEREYLRRSDDDPRVYEYMP